MLKRILAVFVAAAMAMGLTPAMAYATPENDAGGGVTLSSSAPTAKGSEFYANGTPIEITAEAPAGGEPASFDGFGAVGTSAYISWKVSGLTKYVGVGESVFVFGGSDGSAGPVSVGSTSISMTGGTVFRIYGGNSGSQSLGEEGCSKVTGDVNISLSEDAAVKDMVVGGGRYNAGVDGQVNMQFNGVNLSNPDTKCYVMGGVHGNGNEGVRNIDEGTMDTAAVVGRVQINANDSDFYLITAGGGGSTKVKYADVSLRGGSSSGSVYAGGINGEVVESHILIEDSSVDEFAATNRGFVGTCHFDAISAQIDNLYMGATPGCFGSDSGGHDGSGVTGESHWNIDGNTIVKNAVLTPIVKRDGSKYSSIVNTTSITKTGDPMDVALGGFTPVGGTMLGETAVSEFAGLELSNVKMSVKSGHALTNAGSIKAVDGGSIVVEGGATFKNAGKIEGTVPEGEGEGATIVQCAARLGSTGYDTLQDAIDAAVDRADGEDRVTLLKNVNEDINVPAGKRICLDLNGLTLTNASDHTIVNNGTLTVVDSSQDGTGTVDNVSNARAALYNEGSGTVIVVGGNFTRSKEAGTATGGNGNSWYVVHNSGNMQFDGGKVYNTSWYSSLVRNYGVMTINGGEFENEFIALKNDENGKSAQLTITGGTITSKDQAVQNWSTAVIEGGTLNGKVATWNYTGGTGEGKTTIGGDAVVNGDVLSVNYANSTKIPEVTISGGTINGSVVKGTHTGANGATVVVEEPKSGVSTINVAGGAIEATDENKKAIPYFIADDDVAKVDSGMLEIVDRGNLGAGEYIVADGAPDITADDLADGLEVEYDEATGQWVVSKPAPPVVTKPSYDVTVDQPANGAVELSAKTAKEGDKVTVTVKPDAGFELASLVVADEDGNALKLELNADGTYSFEMPAGDVTVHAAFECDGGELCPSHGFTDVDQSQWYHAAIDWAVDNDVLQGVGDGLMLPDGDITRAQMAQVLWNVEGQPAAAEGEGFSDVSEGDWFAGAVAWASQEGIFVGYDGAFDPDAELTREQAATVLMRWAESNGEDVSGRADLSGFPDADGISEWAVESVRWAVDAGVLKGVANPDGTTTVSAQGTATRAQTAALMMRLLEA